MSSLGRSYGAGRLYKERRGDGPDRWILDYKDANGRRRREALSTDKQVAERKRAKIIRSRDLALSGMAGEDGLDLQLVELTAPYLADLATTASPRHVEMVGARLERIFTDTRAELVRDVSPMALIRLRGERLKAGCSVRTANLDGSTVRALFNWATKAGLLGASPLANFAKLPEREATKRCKRRALTEEEIARFLDAAREDDENCALLGPRVAQTPLFRLLVECGPRYGEAVSATWADLDAERRVVTLRAETTKAGRERQIPLRADLVAEILRLRETHALVLRRPTTPRDRIFLSPTGSVWAWNTVNLMRIFVRVLEAAGIDRKDQTGRKIDLHALRHTAATRLARNGVPLAVTQRILGHSDPKLTARVYQHLEVDDLRSAVEGLDVQHAPGVNAQSA